MNRDKSKVLLQKARELKGEEEEKAIEIYNNIIEMDGSWSVPYYNLGLIYKYKGQWKKSYELNLKATELDAQDEAAWWNLGIACTALKKWREARTAWNQFGFELEVSDKPVGMDIGLTPVRLKNKEVIWTSRICPARAYIDNVPLQESGHRYNDLLLIDGAPTGKRIFEGVEYSVFDELEIIEESNYRTYSIGVSVEHTDDITDLKDMCYKLGYGFENWTKSIRILCKQCSEGLPHETHDTELENEENEYNLAIATNTHEELEEVLEEWLLNSNVTVNWIE